jgi:hypothetical protein
VAGRIHELEIYLKTAKIESVTAWPIRSSRPSYQLILEGGVDCLAKPSDEIPGGLAECQLEVAAWIVARDLDWPDLVAATVLREMPSQVGGPATQASVQVVWPRNDRGPDLAGFDDSEKWRAAIFDGLVAHGDRNNTNYLGVPGAAPGVRSRLKLIDHGIGFGNVETGSPFFVVKRGQAIPPEYLQALRHWRAGHLEALQNYLQPVLEFALQIESEAPDAGEAPPGTQPISPQRAEAIFTNVIYGGNNVIAMAGKDVTQRVVVERPEWEGLSAKLTELGLPEETLQDLSRAIDQDSAITSPGEVGPATKRWLGDISTKVALGTLRLGQAATAAVVAAEVLHFLGLH